MRKNSSPKRKASLDRAENNAKANEARTLEAKKGSSIMVISILPNGNIMVQDYSGRDSRKELANLLQEMGIKTETALESLCG